MAIQESCRAEVRIEPLTQSVWLVAGADVAYSRRSHRMYAAVVLVRLPSFEVVERAEWYGRATFPYIPGLLTFREIPPLLESFRRLRMQPDALLFDGQGLAHPRRFGLACHGGLLFDRPSVGCAKSRLVGEHGNGRCRAWLVSGAYVREDKGGDGAPDAAWGQTGLRVARAPCRSVVGGRARARVHRSFSHSRADQARPLRHDGAAARSRRRRATGGGAGLSVVRAEDSLRAEE